MKDIPCPANFMQVFGSTIDAKSEKTFPFDSLQSVVGNVNDKKPNEQLISLVESQL